MGTSQSFKGMTGKPNWSSLSSTVTASCEGGEIADNKLGKILSKYVTLIGGSKKAGNGKSRIGGRAGLRIAKNLGGFLSKVKTIGFADAVRSTGLIDYEQKNPNDIINHMLEYCAGASSSFDDAAAKSAEQKFLQEIVTDALTIHELEEKFEDVIKEYGIEELIVKYFSYYIHEHLAGMFYEKLIKDKGRERCGNLFKQIKDFIFERLKNISREKKLEKINWNGKDGDRILKTIYQDILGEFENYED